MAIGCNWKFPIFHGRRFAGKFTELRQFSSKPCLILEGAKGSIYSWSHWPSVKVDVPYRPIAQGRTRSVVTYASCWAIEITPCFMDKLVYQVYPRGKSSNIGCFTGPWIVRLPGVKNKTVKLPFWSILHFFVGKRIFTSHSIALEETIWPYHDTVSHIHHAKCPYLLLMRPTLMVVPWDQKWKRWNQNVLKRVLESWKV